MVDLPEKVQRTSVPDLTDAMLIDTRAFESAFGEPLKHALDLSTWQPGANLAELYHRLESEVREAVGQERRIRERVRAEVFPRLASRPNAPKNAGVYKIKLPELEQVHKGLLFNGAVEACDGTCITHDTLPLTIVQIGITLVSYRGDQGTWVQRLFRRDLRVAGSDPVEEALAMLGVRSDRDLTDQREKGNDRISNLARRGIMAYAERAVLLQRSTARWRMGHGNPVPYELLTGSGSMDLLEASLATLHELITRHRRFVFVPSEISDRFLLTLGDALNQLEFAVVDTAREQMDTIVSRGKYHPKYSKLAKKFVDDVGPDVVVGVFRTSRSSPAHVFYAHTEHFYEAAAIAMADASLQEHRGFPMLIDLADAVCRTTFGGDTFATSVRLAYADAGEPFRYLGERETRSR